LTSLIDLVESLKKETHTETENTNQNNDTNQNTKMVKCNNLIYKSYLKDLEYDFLNEENERLDVQEEKESLKDQLLKLSRRFNLDLSPNLFYSRGKFIELLISSDTSKYCEFRMVSQIMTRNEHGIIEKVGVKKK
jgi:RAB protein geranylgeranyltransferase component A